AQIDRSTIGRRAIDVDRIVARARVDGQRAGRIDVGQRQVVSEGTAIDGQRAGGQAVDVDRGPRASYDLAVLVIIALILVFISLIVVVSLIVIVIAVA